MGAELMVGVLLGLAIGFGLSAWFDRVKGGDDSAKIKELTSEHDKYRKQVDDHFVNTAVLLKGLTDQYRDVYRHIASGAGELCSEEAKALQTDLEETALLAQVAEPLEAVQAEREVEAESNIAVTEQNSSKDDDIPLASEVEMSADIAQELKSQSANKSA